MLLGYFITDAAPGYNCCPSCIYVVELTVKSVKCGGCLLCETLASCDEVDVSMTNRSE